jgi:hypothetical protein
MKSQRKILSEDELRQEISKTTHTPYARYVLNGNAYIGKEDGILIREAIQPKDPWMFLRVVKELFASPSLKQDIAVYKNTQTGAESRFQRIFILKNGAPTKQTLKGGAIPDRKYPLPDGMDIII